MNTKSYAEAIDDVIELLSSMYERHQDGHIYNAEIKSALETLKKKNDPYWYQKKVYSEIAERSLPKWKKITCNIYGRPVIPENSVARDGYYIDIISLDRLPKEEDV